MRISDILRHKSGAGAGTVVTIAPDDPVAALVDTLVEHNVGAVLALEGDDVVGVVSERDVVRRLARDGAGVLEQPVSAIMTREVRSCTGGDSIDDIAAVMTERRIRHMPVIDDGRLVGIVSIGDVVSSHIRQLEQDRGQLEQYISS